MTRIKTICTFILLLTLFAFRGEAATISGKLKNEKGDVVPSQVLFLNNGKSSLSQTDGSFTFNQVLQGTYELKTELGGQWVTLSYFTIKNNEEQLDLGDVVITKNIQLTEVEIPANHTSRTIERMPDVKDNIIYAGKKNEVVRLSTSTANLAQNNSRQLFAKVPGIQVWESDGSGVQMGIASRGLSPNRMWEFNTRQNGYDISSDPFGYPEAYYTPSVESLDRIEIIRGAASLQFGPQFGGVVNYIKKRSISGKKFGVESMQTYGSYNMFSTFNAIGGNYKKFSYYANINYRRSDGWRANNDYTTWNGFINIGYALSKKINIQLEYTHMDQLVHQPGGLTDSAFAVDAKQSSRSRNWFNLQWRMPAMIIDYKISAKQSAQLKAFGLMGERSSIGFMSSIQTPDTVSRVTGTYRNREIDIDKYTNLGVEMRYMLSYKLNNETQYLSSGVRIYNGTTARTKNTNGNRNSNYTLEAESPVLQRDLEYHTTNYALFAEQLFNINSRLSITPGFRLEILENKSSGMVGTITNNQTSSRQFALFGVAVQYKTTSTTNIYANYTQAYRPVLFSDLTLASSTDSVDQDLADSKGYNIDLGYRGTIGNYLSFDISVFYMMYDQRIGTYTVAGKNYRTNIGASVSKGVESYIEFTPTALTGSRFGKLSVFNTTSLMDARYTNWSNPDPTKDQKDKWVENAPQQIIRTGITYSFKQFSTTFQHSYVSETYADALNTAKPTANGQNGLIPSYEVMDWSASLRFKKHYQVNAGINNLLDTKYFTRRAGGYPGPGLLPADGRLWYIGIGVKL